MRLMSSRSLRRGAGLLAAGVTFVAAGSTPATAPAAASKLKVKTHYWVIHFSGHTERTSDGGVATFCPGELMENATVRIVLGSAPKSYSYGYSMHGPKQVGNSAQFKRGTEFPKTGTIEKPFILQDFPRAEFLKAFPVGEYHLRFSVDGKKFLTQSFTLALGKHC